MTQAPLDRRPIASREARIWIAASKYLARAGVSANSISVAGVIVAIMAGTAAVLTAHTQGITQRVLWFAVALGCQLRLLANMLDGMVAIESRTASPVGELYNEVPDRISDAAVLLGLGYAAGGWPEMGYLAALLAVFTAYVRAACKVVGAPQDFRGPMAKPHRMFLVTVSAILLAVAPAKWQVELRDDKGIAAVVLLLIAIGCVLTAVRRLARSARYLRSAHP